MKTNEIGREGLCNNRWNQWDRKRNCPPLCGGRRAGGFLRKEEREGGRIRKRTAAERVFGEGPFCTL